MNLFGRVLVVLICLGLAASAVAVAVLAWTIPEDALAWLSRAVTWMGEHDTDSEKAVVSAAAGAIAIVALSGVILQLLPRSSNDVKVTDLKVGNAVLSTAAIGQRVEDAVRGVPHVTHVKAYVKAKRRGILVTLDLYVSPDANLVTVTDDAVESVQDVLANRVHAALLQPPQIRLHYRELRLHGRAATASGAGPAAATAMSEVRRSPSLPAAQPAPKPLVGSTNALPNTRQALIRQATDPALGAPLSARAGDAVALAGPGGREHPSV